jgi:hypothetical protein
VVELERVGTGRPGGLVRLIAADDRGVFETHA